MLDTLRQWASPYEHELYFQGFLERYPKWLGNVNSDIEKQILNKLLLKMEFYSKMDIKSILNQKITPYKADCSDFEYTNILPMISKDRRYNGSYDIIGQLIELDREMEYQGKAIFPYRDTVKMDVRDIAEDTDTLIILDDICGTGGTLKKFIQDNKAYMIRKKVIVLFLIITDEALKVVEKIKSDNSDIDLTVDYYVAEEKLSNCSYLTDEEFRILEGIETSLWGPSNNNIFGYKKSELLIGFSHNIPNNTISSIWYKEELGIKKNWSPLFVRYTKKTKPKRKAQNYNVAKRNK